MQTMVHVQAAGPYAIVIVAQFTPPLAFYVGCCLAVSMMGQMHVDPAGRRHKLCPAAPIAAACLFHTP